MRCSDRWTIWHDVAAPPARTSSSPTTSPTSLEALRLLLKAEGYRDRVGRVAGRILARCADAPTSTPC